MDKHSYLGNADSAYIESLYSEYRQDPASVDESWRKFFEGFEFAGGSEMTLNHVMTHLTGNSG
jgi:2-oxoglutarate dehydrogenase E1 component